MEKQTDKKKVKWLNPLRDRTRVVPFIVPSKEQQVCALGSLAGEKWKLKKSLQAIMHEFEPIKTPEPGDNLYEFEEDGQDFSLFSSMRRNHFDAEKQMLYIGIFNCVVGKENMSKIKKAAKAFFWGVKVKFYDFGKTNLQQFHPIQSEQGETYYDAAKMNQYFAKHLPKNTYSVAIVTNLLIYNGNNPKEQLSEKWVFGLGAIKDRTSIISFEEIVKKGYGCKRNQNEKEQEDESEFNIEFLIRVVNHELCHTFGMKHCIYHRCLMNGSNHYQEAVSKHDHLCVICLRKLQLALGFDIADRYLALGDEASISYARLIQKAFVPLQKN